MILPINDKYAITSDTNQWMICRKSMRKTEDGEKEAYWQPFKYYSTLPGAVNGLVDYQLRLSDAEGFVEAIEESKRIVAEIVSALSPEVTVIF